MSCNLAATGLALVLAKPQATGRGLACLGLHSPRAGLRAGCGQRAEIEGFWRFSRLGLLRI